MGTRIKRYLPNNEYQAAISAAAPTAMNPFATMADLAAGGIYGGSGALGGTTVVTVGTNTLDFLAPNASLADSVKFTNSTNSDYTSINREGSIHSTHTATNPTKKIAWGKEATYAPSGTIEISASVSSGYSKPVIIGRSGTIATPDNIAFQLRAESIGQGIIELYKAGAVVSKLRAEADGLHVQTGNLGVGVNPSSAKLHTKGVDTGSGTYSFRAQNSDASHILNYSNIGVLTNTGSIVAGGVVAYAPLTSTAAASAGKIAQFRAFSGSGKFIFTQTGVNPYMTITDSGGTIQTQLSTGGGPPNYIQQRLALGHIVPATNTILHTKTADALFEGTSDANLLRVDWSADNVVIGAATGASKLTVTGGIETVGNGLGLIVAQETSGTRYRIYVDAGGTLAIQLA